MERKIKSRLRVLQGLWQLGREIADAKRVEDLKRDRQQCGIKPKKKGKAKCKGKES